MMPQVGEIWTWHGYENLDYKIEWVGKKYTHLRAMHNNTTAKDYPLASFNETKDNGLSREPLWTKKLPIYFKNTSDHRCVIYQCDDDRGRYYGRNLHTKTDFSLSFGTWKKHVGSRQYTIIPNPEGVGETLPEPVHEIEIIEI